MLTKDSKKLLDLMNSNTPNLDGAYFEISYLAAKFKLDYMNVLSICETLATDNYVAFSGNNKTVVRVLEKGKNYKDLDRQDLIKFLNRSVVIPFFVSLATSLITMVIANYFN